MFDRQRAFGPTTHAFGASEAIGQFVIEHAR
jgi:hypothetical protein